jgi:hypothetical protein
MDSPRIYIHTRDVTSPIQVKIQRQSQTAVGSQSVSPSPCQGHCAANDRNLSTPKIELKFSEFVEQMSN